MNTPPAAYRSALRVVCKKISGIRLDEMTPTEIGIVNFLLEWDFVIRKTVNGAEIVVINEGRFAE